MPNKIFQGGVSPSPNQFNAVDAVAGSPGLAQRFANTTLPSGFNFAELGDRLRAGRALEGLVLPSLGGQAQPGLPGFQGNPLGTGDFVFSGSGGDLRLTGLAELLAQNGVLGGPFGQEAQPGQFFSFGAAQGGPVAAAALFP